MEPKIIEERIAKMRDRMAADFERRYMLAQTEVISTGYAYPFTAGFDSALQFAAILGAMEAYTSMKEHQSAQDCLDLLDKMLLEWEK